MPWRRSFLVWLLFVVVEFAHGALRTLLLAPAIGDWRARQVSVFTGSVLIVAIASLVIRWLRPTKPGAIWSIGGLWLILMVAFELLFGRFVLGFTWSRIWSDYDLPHGGLLPFGLLVLFLSPRIGAKLRGYSVLAAV